MILPGFQQAGFSICTEPLCACGKQMPPKLTSYGRASPAHLGRASAKRPTSRASTPRLHTNCTGVRCAEGPLARLHADHGRVQDALVELGLVVALHRVAHAPHRHLRARHLRPPAAGVSKTRGQPSRAAARLRPLLSKPEAWAGAAVAHNPARGRALGKTPRDTALAEPISSRAGAQGPTFRAPAAMTFAPVMSCPVAVKHTTATAKPIQPARTHARRPLAAVGWRRDGQASTLRAPSAITFAVVTRRPWREKNTTATWNTITAPTAPVPSAA